MLKKKILLYIAITSFTLMPGFSWAQDSRFDSMNEYLSFGTEYYQWIENVDKLPVQYVTERGVRFRTNLGADDYRTAQKGLLKAWGVSIILGGARYKVSALHNNIDIPNG